MKSLCLLVLINQILTRPSLACAPAVRTLPGGSEVNVSDTRLWGGFPPPEGATDWQAWLAKFMEGEKRVARETADAASANGDLPKDRPSGIEDDWPNARKGITNMGNAKPRPPWAYVPKNSGKAPFCSQPPLKGNCSQTLSRFAFNPSLEECVPIVYSGCHGNQNNFPSKESCEAACRSDARAGREPSSGLTRDEIIAK